MTPEQIDRVLPRAATWPPRIYDMTDTDERREACEWVAGIVNAAETPANTEEDIWTSINLLRSWRQSRDSAPESPESDENAEQVSVDPGNGTEAHRGSVWPPPAKGTHEGDLGYGWDDVIFALIGDASDTETGRGGWKEYDVAQAWSRTPDHPPAPGITYHGRDDER